VFSKKGKKNMQDGRTYRACILFQEVPQVSGFLTAVEAVWPFVLYFATGVLVRRYLMHGQKAIFAGMNKIAFNTMLSVVIFRSIYNIESGELYRPRYILYIFCFMLAVIAAGALLAPHITKDRKKIGVLVMSLFRGNTLLFALPLAVSVYGGAAESFAGALIAMVVPVYNVLGVLILTFYSDDQKISIPSLIKKLLTNPMIVGALLGLLLRFFPRLPDGFLKPFNALADAATPVAVMALGGNFEMRDTWASMKYIAPVLIGRFVIIPALDLLISRSFGFQGIEVFMAIMLYVTPVAIAAYPTAVSMGGDGELMGEIVALSTVVSPLAIVIWITLMTSLQII
jgi:predicted permease